MLLFLYRRPDCSRLAIWTGFFLLLGLLLVTAPFLRGADIATPGVAGDEFGVSVGLSGTTVLVGARFTAVGSNAGQGAAYFYGDAGATTGTAAYGAELEASDGAANDYFGYRVSLSGTTGLVGAYRATVGASPQQGEAYLYRSLNAATGTVEEDVKLVASDGAALDFFGCAVSLSGTTALVGAYGARVGVNSNQGAAYVYRSLDAATGTVIQSAKLVASDGTSGDEFGFALSLSGTAGLVGAVGVNGFQGAAYFYRGLDTATGTVHESAKLVASDGAAIDEFGYAVSLSGTMGLVGACNATVGGVSNQGAAYLYRNLDTAAGTVHETAKLIVSDGAYEDSLGGSVSLSGTTGLVGAFHTTVGSNVEQGTAYLYRNLDAATGTVTEDVKLFASDGAANDRFGASVILSDDNFAVGGVTGGKVYTGTVSSMTTLDFGNTREAISGISFVSHDDWIVGKATGGNQVTLGAGDSADVRGTGKAVYIGQNAGSNDNTLVIRGTLLANEVVVGGAGTTGNALVFDSNGSQSFDGTISGTGALVKQGTGTFVYAGGATYTGLTTVSAGTVALSGSIVGTSGVEIAAGATLDLSGAIGAVTAGAGGIDSAHTLTVGSGGIFGGGGTLVGDVIVRSGGTLAPGDPATTHIAGNLTLDAGSQTVVTVASTGSCDRIAVTGAAHLGGTLVVNPLTGYAPRAGDSFTFLTAAGVTGSFDGVTNGLGNAIQYALAYDTAGIPNAVGFTATQGSFAPFAAPGQLGLAQALDHWAARDPDAAVIRYLDTRPGSEYAADFVRLTPVQETAVAQTSVQTSHAAFNTLHSRMDAIRSGSTGLSLSQFNWLDQNIPGSALIAGTELPAGVKAFTPSPTNRWGFFAAANGNFGDIDGQTSQSNYHGGGFTVGSDYRLDPAFAVGFAVGYDYSKTDFAHNGSSSTANTVRFGPYATWKNRGGDWVDGTAGGAVHFYDSNRDGLGGMATSDTTGTEFDASLQYGHDFHAGQWTLTPTFGLDYLHLDIGGYTESGSLAPLAIQEQTIDSLRSNLGGAVGYVFRWKGIGWHPYVQAGWAHEFLDASQSVNARFAAGAGDVFTTTGDNLGRDSATFGAGLSADFTEALTANLSYAGEANDRYQDHSFNAAVRMAF